MGIPSEKLIKTMEDKEFNLIIGRCLNDLKLADATVEESVNVAAGLTANILGHTMHLCGFMGFKEAERLFNKSLREYMLQIVDQSKNN